MPMLGETPELEQLFGVDYFDVRSQVTTLSQCLHLPASVHH